MPLPVVGKPSGEEPGGDFTWFIYGSSLDAASLEAWSREHGYAPPDLGRGKPARLAGWRLSFDVVSRHWGGAVASIEEASGDWVEGLAVPMPASARGLVDHKEGVVTGLYRPVAVRVRPVAGGPEVDAIAYRAAPGRRLATEGAPAFAFLDAVVRGARACGLSAGWIERLEALEKR